MLRNVQRLLPRPSERESCGAVEEAKVESQRGLVVPTPRLTSELSQKKLELFSVSAVAELANGIDPVVQLPWFVPPFAVAMVPLSVIAPPPEPTTLKPVQESGEEHVSD